MSFKRIGGIFSSVEFSINMVGNLKSVYVEAPQGYQEKLNRFRSVDTETLLSLYYSIDRTYKAILTALDTATSAQSFYFSADAGNCSKTMSEIRNVLFARGIRNIPTILNSNADGTRY